MYTGPTYTMPFSKRMSVRPTGTPSTNSPSITLPPRSNTYPYPLIYFTEYTLSSNSKSSQCRSRRSLRKNLYSCSSSFLPSLPPSPFFVLPVKL